MLNKKEVAAIIPIYKDNLSYLERIAWNQALKVFRQYDIVVVAPENLYIPFGMEGCRVERFSEEYFQSISSYNKLMLTLSFYQRFIEYEYILIYQLDAFVFSNQLSYWCELGYDYIGAPWLYGLFHYVDGEHCVWYVGNGGLSLRKVSSFISVLNERKPLQNGIVQNEDLFFSSINSDHFTVAPLEIALQFSFEQQVEMCYEKNNFAIPFGCHAWSKYNLSFWKPYIEQQGYSLAEYEKTEGEDFLLEQKYEGMKCLADLWKDPDVRSVVRNHLIMNIKGKDKQYIIFGAGYIGRGLGKWLAYNQIPFQGYCDNNMLDQNKEIDGYPVIKPKELIKYKGKIIVILAILHGINELVAQLQSMKFEEQIDYIVFNDIKDIVTRKVV